MPAAVAVTLLTLPHSSPAQTPRKRVLAWADTLTGYQHDSISHALATMERLQLGSNRQASPSNGLSVRW